MRLDRFRSKTVAAVRFVAQRGLLKPVVRCVVKVSVHGEDQLTDLRPPFIVVANHASHLDAPVILGWLPRRHSRYLAAGAAADYFFDVWWRKWLTMLFFSAFAIERKGERKRGGVSRSLLDRGVPLLIFPEGGRSRSGAVRPFKRGAAALAIMSEVPCVPVALVGTSAAMPSGATWPTRGEKRGRSPCVFPKDRGPSAPHVSKDGGPSAPRARSGPPPEDICGKMKPLPLHLGGKYSRG